MLLPPTAKPPRLLLLLGGGGRSGDAVDLRLPKPKPFRREFIELIRGTCNLRGVGVHFKRKTGGNEERGGRGLQRADEGRNGGDCSALPRRTWGSSTGGGVCVGEWRVGEKQMRRWSKEEDRGLGQQ